MIASSKFKKGDYISITDHPKLEVEKITSDKKGTNFYTLIERVDKSVSEIDAQATKLEKWEPKFKKGDNITWNDYNNLIVGSVDTDDDGYGGTYKFADNGSQWGPTIDNEAQLNNVNRIDDKQSGGSKSRRNRKSKKSKGKSRKNNRKSSRRH